MQRHQEQPHRCRRNVSKSSMERASLLLFLALCCYLRAASSSNDEWLNHGGGIGNWRYARKERKISTATAKNLALKWEFVAGSDISATPAIYEGVVYFPSWNGFLYALEQRTGSLIWSKNLTQLTDLPTTVPRVIVGVNYVISRTTPTVYKDRLLVGLIGPANVLALDRHTGSLLWSTQIEDHPWAALTQSGTAHNGFYYIGVSSFEEPVAIIPGLECCYFIGSLVKLEIATGKVLWKTLMLPDNGGQTGLYAGAAVWGSSPAIDPRRKLVYIATGNLYTLPPDVGACEKRLENTTNPEVSEGSDPCLGPEILANAIVALELSSGKIRWGKSLGRYGAWTFACIGGANPNCPPGPALDYDFGEAPVLLTVPRPSNKSSWVDVAVAGQKSGIVWALDRDTGDFVWDTVAGPGGSLGGAIWGAATDGQTFYTNIANNEGKNFTLSPSNEVTRGGGWVALNATTGEIKWTTASPNNTVAAGPVSLANGVLLVTNTNPGGEVLALDAKNGHILWRSFTPNGSVNGGFSVSDGCAFVGAGYQLAFRRTPGTSLYAFCVD